MSIHIHSSERRHYSRLEHIFPVEFRFVSGSGKILSGWYQAYTQDVSRGGLCLTVNNIVFADSKYLVEADTHLELRIHIPLKAEAVSGTGRLAWHQVIQEDPMLQYALGVVYEKIDIAGNNRIIKYVRTRKFFKALAVTFSIFLSAGLVVVGIYNTRLRFENEKLLSSLSVNLAQQKILKQGSQELKSQIEEMKFLMAAMEHRSWSPYSGELWPPRLS